MSSSIPRQVLRDSNNNTPIPDSSANPPTVCVFCGASPGTSPAHLAAARDLARALHKNGMHLVYGGGTVGMMGEVAKTLVELSGPEAVHGIIPSALLRYERDYDDTAATFDENGIAHKDGGSGAKHVDENKFGKTTVVKDMHSRKHLMAREVIEGGPGGGFVALSGGYGTLEEVMEVTTWNQLGIHARGIVLYNVEGYWDGLVQWVNKAVDSGFISESNKRIMVEATDAEEVVNKLRSYKNSDGRFDLRWGEK